MVYNHLTNAGNPNIIHNGSLLKYDANDGGTCIVLGTISGAGPIQVNAGTLNLFGANTFTGGITLSGGTLIAGSVGGVNKSGSGTWV